MSGASNTIIVKRLFPQLPEAEQTALWQHKERMYRALSSDMKPLAGLLHLLAYLDSLKMPTIVVTNAPREDAVHTLGVLGLLDRFGPDMVIGMECSRPKPYPDPYLEGLRRLGLSAAECIAFEDSSSGLGAAVAAGLYTVGVCTGLSAAQMLEKGASLAIQDFTDSKLKKLFEAGEPLEK